MLKAIPLLLCIVYQSTSAQKSNGSDSKEKLNSKLEPMIALLDSTSLHTRQDSAIAIQKLGMKAPGATIAVLRNHLDSEIFSRGKIANQELYSVLKVRDPYRNNRIQRKIA